ncbi:hypothetical protein APHAL10511_003309, partial [Amanita phalloides]
LCASFFPSIVYAKVRHRIEYLNQHNKPDPEHGGGYCSGTCMIHCCLTGLLGSGWILQ